MQLNSLIVSGRDIIGKIVNQEVKYIIIPIVVPANVFPAGSPLTSSPKPWLSSSSMKQSGVKIPKILVSDTVLLAEDPLALTRQPHQHFLGQNGMAY